jgi:hypothetical protein
MFTWTAGIVSFERRDPFHLFGAMVIDFLVFILRFILEVVFLELMCLVGRLALRAGGVVMSIASLGGVHVAPFHVPLREFNRFGCRRSGDGQIEVESTVAGGIGLLICAVCLAVILHFF